MVKLVYGFHQESSRVVELEVGLHHRCPGIDYRSSGVMKLVMRLHHGSPRVVKLVMGFHYKRCKKMKFMMELYDGSPKEHEASVEASL